MTLWQNQRETASANDVGLLKIESSKVTAELQFYIVEIIKTCLWPTKIWNRDPSTPANANTLYTCRIFCVRVYFAAISHLTILVLILANCFN
jgi:hypothetical protein